MRQSGGSFEASNSVGLLIPERPASAEDQKLSTPTPMGETMPRPVITGWRRTAAISEVVWKEREFDHVVVSVLHLLQSGLVAALYSKADRIENQSQYVQ